MELMTSRSQPPARRGRDGAAAWMAVRAVPGGAVKASGANDEARNAAFLLMLLLWLTRNSTPNTQRSDGQDVHRPSQARCLTSIIQRSTLNWDASVAVSRDEFLAPCGGSSFSPRSA